MDGLAGSVSWQKVLALLGAWAGFSFVVRPIAERWLMAVLRKAQEGSKRSKREKEQRAQTIVRVVSATLMVGLTTALLLVSLAALGFNIGPLLAGAGVIGFAIGFGSQNLVRDIINGLFILLEDQLGVGDIVEINGVRGKVEGFNLRRTMLRDEEGVAYYIANSTIGRIANFTQDWAFVAVVVKVGVEEKVETVSKLLEQVARSVAKEPKFKEMIEEEPSVTGPEDLGGGVMTFKVRLKVDGGSQWQVKRELLKKLKEETEKAGVAIK